MGCGADRLGATGPHQTEMPSFVVLPILNVAIIAAINDATVFLRFLPDLLKQARWTVPVQPVIER